MLSLPYWLPLLLACYTGSVFAQSHAVTGRVTDDARQPIVGATVLVKGTTTGTATDAEGKYSLNVPTGQETLVFSFIGSTTEEVAIDGRAEINVQLVPDVQTLTEITVLGYGEQVQRRNLSGSVASIKAKELENVPAASVEQLMQGRAAGVQITQNSGAPGGGITVRIRGTTSVSADNQPLWVVDGVPIRNEGIVGSLAAGSTNSPISDLNPADIESIEVLKDASTAAIYGARAANGVVLVTTKRGKAGKAQIDFSSQTGVSIAPPKIPLLDATQSKAYLAEFNFQTGKNEAAQRLDPSVTNRQRFQFGWYPEGIRSVDWQEMIRQNGPFHNYNLGFRGGNQNSVLYSISGGYVDEKGTVLNTRYRRANLRTNLDFFPVDRLQVGTSLNLSNSNTNLADRGTFFTDPIELSLRKFPDIQVYQVNPEDGTPTNRLFGEDLYNRANPYAVATNLTNVEQQTRGYGNVFAQYQLIKNVLTLRASYGADYTNANQRRFQPKEGYFNPNRPIQQQSVGNITWFQDYVANYFKALGKHEVQGLAAFSQQYSKNTALRVNGEGGASDQDPGRYIGNASRVTGWSTPDVPNGLSSLSAKGTYTYDEFISVSALLKREASSRFPKDTRVGYFPAVSGYFRFTKLPFLAGSGLVSDLKARASWGATGNQNGIGDYQYLSNYGAGLNYIGNVGVATAFVPNLQLKWETTHTTNLGLDVGLLGGRFYLSADYYVKNTRDLLLPVNLPTTSGFASYLGNVGNTRNKGWELAFQGDLLNADGFRWNVNYNIAGNTNRLVKAASGEDLTGIFNGADGAQFQGIGRVGQPLGTWYGLRALDVLPYDTDAQLTQVGVGDDGKPLYEPLYLNPGGEVALDEEGEPMVLRSSYSGRDFVGGDLLYEDVNKDGVIDKKDWVVIGNAQPKFYGGLNNSFSYRGFSVDVFFQYSVGGDVINATRQLLEGGGYGNNASASMARSWRTQGDVTDIPRLGDVTTDSQGSGINAFGNTSRWIEDGSYLRLKNVTVGYNLPKNLVTRLRAGNIRLYVTGQNVLTFTRYKGYDPEFNNSTNVLLLGVDYLNYPLPRRFVGGVNFTF